MTRACLEELAKREGLSVSVITKSNQIVRDIDVFQRIAARSELSLNITVTTLRTRLARLLEPRAPRPDLRLKAVQKLSEAGLHVGGEHRETTLNRAEHAVSAVQASLTRRLSSGMSFLASIGSNGPFIGLFGTVYGIMDSFIGIANTNTTNLAVVAPGIAEALLATAIGLVAAIPAVIIYNHFARVTKSYLELVNRASGAAARLLSRDLDRTHVTAAANPRSRASAAE